jgi:hypothetical protein
MDFNEVRIERACNMWKHVTNTLPLAGTAARANVSMETDTVTIGQYISICVVGYLYSAPIPLFYLSRLIS